ncbi:hypothetical protein C1H46_006857 [Malus baccata]|uniref:RPW8 domain-containing protein n=1 Tax=Malus baccata TaxID=106549 RepID=A0A540N922_MALBA|nr:hypothetical protein C1H46_006857 [Malus baccata]
MVNGVDIAVGGVSGAAFGWIFDGITEISIQLDDCKTEIVNGISAWNGKTTDQLGEVASNGKETLDYTKRILDGVERINGFGGFVPISEKVASWVEEEALGSSLVTMGHSVDEALSKPLPHLLLLERVGIRFQELNKYWYPGADENRKLDMGVHEVKWFRIKVEEGTELIRKCSNVVEWTDQKMVKYANKLEDLVKFLEAFVQRLKRTNITKPKGFDTQNSILCIQSSIGIC